MLETGRSEISRLAAETVLYPQEKLLAVKTDRPGLSIGVPRECSLQEKRVPITPDAVTVLVNNGNTVTIESKAGEGGKFTDHQYSDAGARIAYSHEQVFENSEIIVKVNPPTIEEIGFMKSNTSLISALQLTQLNSDYIKALNEKQISAIAFELMQDEEANLPIVRAMSEIAGSTVLLIAAEYLNSNNNGRGIILGGITGVPPTKVVIIGAGTAAEYAARIALGLGAEVKIFDNKIYKLRRLKQELGHSIYTSTIDVTNLTDALKRADIVIGAMRAEEGRSPCVVTEEMVGSMKPDSLIIDISIDQGGCFETSEVTTHENPVFKKYDVIHYCVPNIPSRVAHTASQALSHILTPVLLQAQDQGGMEDLIFNRDWFMRGVYTYRGSLTDKHIGRLLNMRTKDLNLFKIARF